MQLRHCYGLCLVTSFCLLLVSACVAQGADVEPLPGTKPLTVEGDVASQMVDGIDRFLMRQIEESVANRPQRPKASEPLDVREEWLAARRKEFARSIGVVDERAPFDGLELVTTTSQPAEMTKEPGIYKVRWPVLPGVYGEGILLAHEDLRKAGAAAKIGAGRRLLIAIPDADQTPEMIAGLAQGDAALPWEAQFARRLHDHGATLIVPYLINRDDTLSVGVGGSQATNQPHREYIYRQSYELGRHVIGYEVQKVLALVDWRSRQTADEFSKINTVPREKENRPRAYCGVIGYGEGGLLALYAAALDDRITHSCVSGYFGPRERVWEEPIYRNVFGLLKNFGDAELAALIAPRKLIVESCKSPEVNGPPTARKGRAGAAPGRLITLSPEATRKEIDRARALVGLSGWELLHVSSRGGSGPAGCLDALEPLFDQGMPAAVSNFEAEPKQPAVVGVADPARPKRQFTELVDYTQKLLAESEYTRDKFWSKADRQSRSVEKWKETSAPYRDYFYNQVIGRFEIDKLPPNVRTRKVYDEPKYTGYEVMLDVFPDVLAYGILLVPKDIKDGEKRPVVVCQHGLEGRPQDVADPKINNPAYNQYAIRLAERGFITYAPQNPYIFQDRFRVLQRKLNPLGKTLFSIVVPQHEQTVDWLASLPMVDAEKIGFYGLSYGGKTAMRVPAIVQKYCLSICSADFNEWIWKNTSSRSSYSYLHSGEYEIFEFDLGNTFNYAEMAGLIAPRPFMVERGHRDGVAPDPWVAFEYAKVRLLYADLKIPERTTIEFFDGPHTIHGVGTFEFLEKQLRGR